MPLKSFPQPPPSLQPDQFAVQWLAKLVNTVVSEAVPDAVSSGVSVDAADATDLATVITLANETKADLNQLVADLDAGLAQLNALLAALRASGSLET